VSFQRGFHARLIEAHDKYEVVSDGYYSGSVSDRNAVRCNARKRYYLLYGGV
jgi:hypothetical protein